MNVSTATSLLLVNTFQASGTVNLPSALSNLGRILIIKDQTASFDTNPCTLQADSGDAFETGQTTRVLSVKGETLELLAGVDRKWYTLADTQYLTQTVQELTAATVSTLTFSTSNLIAPAQAQQQTIIL